MMESSAQASPRPHPRMAELDLFVGRRQAVGRFHDTPFGSGKSIEMVITGSSEDRGFWTVIRTEEVASFTRSGDDRYHHIGETDLGDGWIAVDDEDATRVGRRL